MQESLPTQRTANNNRAFALSATAWCMKRHLKATKFFQVFPRCAGVFGQGICDGTNMGYDPIAVALSAGAVFFEDMLEEIGNEALRYGYEW